ncbi:RidA family protein [Brucella anthropi]|jgi:enamine deaminase RidA (YjgF/YER057c/UK114 family)|uniref:RidA family protein n=4 Tax=Brucella/Ochrobactrum group TaxID=2826938 RepID=A0A011SZN1_BRUAN|nr:MULTISPECIES: RidA family protein [Brucella/Ochrobactrum group]MCI0998842.1 RidA family protein [Ochrobactrum sp. C6C9]MCR5939420.1 RidA family protein [Ochrobactrum sp. XJ1]RNL46661.1 RidA family protein [Ochrobactrum sp. MH181795]RRD26912.1 RidA family protein [Brucellaceae bacterium VT-16-1752]WHT43553.1 RidA family protein [Ochrobactrum sp. SSR]
MHKTLQPQGWARPIGYANGVEARGRTVYIGGQIGWNEQQQFETDDFVEQTEQTLKNIVAILAEAGGRPEHIASMTWYFTDKAEYTANLKGIGRAYRDVIGKHFPAMAAVQVVALVEDRAKIEIQAFAVIPD